MCLMRLHISRSNAIYKRQVIFVASKHYFAYTTTDNLKKSRYKLNIIKSQNEFYSARKDVECILMNSYDFHLLILLAPKEMSAAYF